MMRPLIRPIEWRAVLVYAFFLMLLTSLPYAVAASVDDSQWVFIGHVFGLQDGNAYLGKMRLGARGYWEFFLFYSSEPHNSEFLFYLPYIGVGQIAGLFYDSTDPDLFTALIVGFHGLRLIVDMALVFVTYRFIAEFISPPSMRLLALILSTVGGGLGWLLIILGQAEWFGDPPIEYFVPEGFGFLVVFGLPHIAFARTALLAGFILLFRALRRERWLPWAVASGVCWLLVGLGVSLYLAILYCLMAAWGLVTWIKQRRFPLQLTLRGAVPTAMTFPLFFYNVWVFTQNDIFSSWTNQMVFESPHPLHYVFAYGIWYGLAAIAMIWFWKNRATEPVLLLMAWVLAMPLLVSLPINAQRRMAEGVIVPLAILSVLGLELLVPALAKRSYRRAWRRGRALLLTVLSLSTGLLVFGVTITALNPSHPQFRPQAEMDALDWLNTYGEENSVVLGVVETGNVIPARTNFRVFVGHGPETADFVNKDKLTNQFFADELSTSEQADLLTRYGIDYIVAGPRERELSDTMQWAQSLNLIYDANGYQIYEVRR